LWATTLAGTVPDVLASLRRTAFLLSDPRKLRQCAQELVDQVADTGRMTEQEKKLGQQMTIYFVTEVLWAHGANSVYSAASAQG
jgi:hypothetical protein